MIDPQNNSSDICGDLKYMSHHESFVEVCKEGELDIVKAMVERTQVNLLEVMGSGGSSPLHMAAADGQLPVVQYLCEQGADKDARGEDDKTPLYKAAAVCSTCVSRGLIRRRGMIVVGHHCTWQNSMVTSLWCSTCASTRKKLR